MPVFKFLLEQPGECPRWGGTLSGQGKCPGDMPEGECPGEMSYTRVFLQFSVFLDLAVYSLPAMGFC